MLVYKSLQVYEAGKLEDKRNGGLSEATKTADVFGRCLDRVKKSRNKKNNAEEAPPRRGNRRTIWENSEALFVID